MDEAEEIANHRRLPKKRLLQSFHLEAEAAERETYNSPGKSKFPNKCPFLQKVRMAHYTLESVNIYTIYRGCTVPISNFRTKLPINLIIVSILRPI